MAEEQKTLSDRMHDMWEKVTEPSKPGVEVGADLQAQAAAYDYAVRMSCVRATVLSDAWWVGDGRCGCTRTLHSVHIWIVCRLDR